MVKICPDYNAPCYYLVFDIVSYTLLHLSGAAGVSELLTLGLGYKGVYERLSYICIPHMVGTLKPGLGL